MPGPGTVADLRKSTVKVNYGGTAGPCPPVGQPAIATAVADPAIKDALHATNAANVLQTVEQIVPKVKAAAPQAQQADIVNGLTLAYCPVVRQDKSIPEPQKVTQLHQFSERVYSELKNNGKE